MMLKPLVIIFFNFEHFKIRFLKNNRKPLKLSLILLIIITIISV